MKADRMRDEGALPRSFVTYFSLNYLALSNKFTNFA